MSKRIKNIGMLPRNFRGGKNVRRRRLTSVAGRIEQLESRRVLSVNWADTLGTDGGKGVDYDFARDVAIGPDGSTYVAGTFDDSGTIDFDDQSDDGEISRRKKGGRGGADGFLAKYDENGSFQWVVHATNGFNAWVQAVATDSQGNAYISGMFNEPFDFYRNDSFQTSVPQSTAGAGEDIFLAKISNDGTVVWAESIGGEHNQRGGRIAILEDGVTGAVDLFVTGSAVNGGDLDPGPGTTLEDAVDGDRYGFLAKYHFDSGLHLDWFAARETGGGWLEELDVTEDRVLGVGLADSATGFVGVFDTSSGVLLEETSPSSYALFGGVDSLSNDFVVSGIFEGVVDLDGDGDDDLVGDDSRRGFVARYNYDLTQAPGSRLSVAWAQGVVDSDANNLFDIRVTPTGQVYAAGNFSGTFNVDGVELQSIQSSQDALIISVDPQTGTLLSAEPFGGAGGDEVRILKVDSRGRIHAIGNTDSPSLQFPYVSEAMTTDGSRNGFISVFTPVTPGNPPVADAGPGQAGAEDQLLTFDASSSDDPDDDTLTYRWDFGDGTTVEVDTPTVTHAYPYGGFVFDVTLTVLDGTGNSDTVTTTANVAEVNDIPFADAGGPYTGIENQPVTFDASQSFDFDNQDGTPANDQTLTYFWDFGDDGLIDAVTTDKQVDHVFSLPGTYAVRLVVDDGTATSESTTTAEITEALAGIEMYIFDIRFESRRGGKDYRAVVEIRTVLGDLPVQGAAVKVDFAGTSYSLETDADGIARTNWERRLSSGNYYADAYDLALAGHIWTPFEFDLEDDSDGDGKADDLLFV